MWNTPFDSVCPIHMIKTHLQFQFACFPRLPASTQFLSFRTPQVLAHCRWPSPTSWRRIGSGTDGIGPTWGLWGIWLTQVQSACRTCEQDHSVFCRCSSPTLPTSSFSAQMTAIVYKIRWGLLEEHEIFHVSLWSQTWLEPIFWDHC